MIKLTTTQAKAVAVKIRQKISEYNDSNREALRKKYVESKEYEAQRQEVYKMLTHIYQTSLKLGVTLGIRVPGCYGLDIYKGEEITEYTNRVMREIVNNYLNNTYNKIRVPSIEDIVDDLIFDSLMCDDLQTLMNNYLVKCYENKDCNN